jgi:enoyl-CoA hydratase/carnithine racemase
MHVLERWEHRLGLVERSEILIADPARARQLGERFLIHIDLRCDAIENGIARNNMRRQPFVALGQKLSRAFGRRMRHPISPIGGLRNQADTRSRNLDQIDRRALADGPTFGHAMTKRCIHQEWSMGVDEAIEAEAQAQAICMQTLDYERAYEAFVKKPKPVFEGN